MSDEEIDQLIAELRVVMARNGFGPAADEAEAGLYVTAGRRARAIALIDAAEGVTCDLASIEIRVLNDLDVAEIEFKPDHDDLEESETRPRSSEDDEGAATVRVDQLRGLERRALLEKLASQKAVYQELRKRLDGEQ